MVGECNMNDNQNNSQIELLEPVKDEKPIIDKTRLLMNNLRDPRKNKKLIITVFGVLVAIIGIVLFISMQKKYNIGGPQLNDDGTIAIETGTKWGDSYATFIQKEMADYTQYDVALVDLDFNGTPEMLVKYQDKSEQDTLKIFYITEGDVFSTNYFHLYSIHMLYSIVTKEVNWYIHISSIGEYGAYTRLDKVINGTTYDSDIKTSTAKLLEEFKKSYVDAKYKLVFYQVNSNSFENDIKTIVSRYSTYEKDINNTIDKLKDDSSDKEYTSDNSGSAYENLDNLTVKGRKISFGTYLGYYNDENNIAQTSQIVLSRNGMLTYNGLSYKYEVGYDKIIFDNDNYLDVTDNNMFFYDKVAFTLFKDENGNEVS